MYITKHLAVLTLLCSLPATAIADESTLIRSFDDLLKLLDDDSVTHQTERDEQIVLIPVAKGQIDGTMMIRWAADDGVAHFVQTMDLEVPEERMNAIREAIARMNHASPVPGLGINPDARVLYFRMSPTTAPAGGLTAEKIRTCFSHTLEQAAAMQGIMRAVIQGSVEAKNVVDAYNESIGKSTPIPAGRYEVTLGGETWTLAFDNDDLVELYRGDEKVVVSSCSTDGPQVMFKDHSGALKVDEPGVYEWRCMDDKLQFRVVDDSSKGRQMVLTSGVWTRK